MVKASRREIQHARGLVQVRDNGLCVICWEPATDLHHRRRKGMGGSAKLERASNLITLCGLGNTSGHHGFVHQNPRESNEYGWLLYEHQDPEDTPILTPYGWFLLFDNGQRQACAPPVEVG